MPIGGRGAASGPQAGEHAQLAGTPVALHVLTEIDGLLDDLHQGPPHGTGAVERTGLDERLDDGLVDGGQIDAFAEVVEIAEAPAGFAGVENRLHRFVAHAAYGRQAEADGATLLSSGRAG